MFKGYELLEQAEDQIKIRHIVTGDLSFRYRAYCNVCGKDRGWKKKSKLNKPCKSCVQHLDYIVTIDPKSIPNVDLKDNIIHKKPKKGSEKRYKTKCLSCGKDRGYMPLSSSHKLCRTCSRKQIHSLFSRDKKVERAIKISKSQSGEVEFNGFKTPETDRQRCIFKSLGLSRQCFDRDNFTCDYCSSKGKTLHAHHLNGFDKFPDQRFSLINLITLCDDCHNAFHIKYGKGNNTKEQYLEFKKSKQ